MIIITHVLKRTSIRTNRISCIALLCASHNQSGFCPLVCELYGFSSFFLRSEFKWPEHAFILIPSKHLFTTQLQVVTLKQADCFVKSGLLHFITESGLTLIAVECLECKDPLLGPLANRMNYN